MNDYPMPATDTRYAGFWIRTAAHIVDSLIITALLVPILFVIYRDQFLGLITNNESGELSSLFELDQELKSPLGYFLQYGLPAIAIIFLWRAKSATPGKMLLKMVIVDADGKSKLRMTQCLIRYLGYAIPMVPVLLFGAFTATMHVIFLGLGILTLPLTMCFFWILWDRRKQGWHDKLANTVVVHTN